MARRERRDGWFLQRGYPHLDRPLHFNAADALVKDQQRIGKLAFFPFLGYIDRKRKFGSDNTLSLIPKRDRPKIIKIKNRDLKYASHRDAYIYSYYAKVLSVSYEDYLRSNGLDGCVVGYRSGLGSNIDIAATAFAEIEARGTCTALCFDIKDFFPSIPHKILKFNLSTVLGCGLLSKDWYNVFRSMTRFSWIDIDQLFFWCLIDPREAPNPICNDPASLLEDLRRAGMIRRNPKSDRGIPQGAPISAIFANVAMLEFDRAMQTWAVQNGATYMRYSDDILVICDTSLRTAAESEVEKNMTAQGGCLDISPDKTERCAFDKSGGTLTSDCPLTYLGFTFDGQTVRLRDRTLSRYYRRMTYATRGTNRRALAAFKAGIGPAAPYRRKLYQDFSHLGSSNFYTYAKRAHNKFEFSLIKRQLRRHFRILLRKLNNHGR